MNSVLLALEYLVVLRLVSDQNIALKIALCCHILWLIVLKREGDLAQVVWCDRIRSVSCLLTVPLEIEVDLLAAVYLCRFSLEAAAHCSVYGIVGVRRCRCSKLSSRHRYLECIVYRVYCICKLLVGLEICCILELQGHCYLAAFKLCLGNLKLSICSFELCLRCSRTESHTIRQLQTCSEARIHPRQLDLLTVRVVVHLLDLFHLLLDRLYLQCADKVMNSVLLALEHLVVLRLVSDQNIALKIADNRHIL